MEKTTLYLPVSLQSELRSLAKSTGRPQAELIREALTEYVGRQDHPWPKSIGVVSDGSLAAHDAKAWVHAQWDVEDERRQKERDAG